MNYHIGRLVLSSLCVEAVVAADIWWCSFCRLKLQPAKRTPPKITSDIKLGFHSSTLLYASTCFEHHVLIISMSKLYYTASGIITPVGGRPVHMSSLNLCTGRPPTGVMIPDAV